MNSGWHYSPEHGQICQVIETQKLWGEATCRLWIPGKDAVVRIPASKLSREREKGEFAFAARRRSIERIGLPAVRMHRLAQLEQEERVWRDELLAKKQVIPEMIPLAIVRVGRGAGNG
ncbi:MAG TPA: hypothetical protein VMX56_05130 [Anaerolineales bacterium]|nr:hypothetical protein [Anaerolineales bacterium]